MITILVTAGHNPASGLIISLTGEPASHVAYRWGDWVLHSNFGGVRWTPYTEFAAAAVILDELPSRLSTEELLDLSARYVERGSYDYGAILYCGLKLAAGKLGIQLPKKNLWQMTGMHMCTEWVTHGEYGQEDSLITPWKLRNRIRASLTEEQTLRYPTLSSLNSTQTSEK